MNKSDWFIALIMFVGVGVWIFVATEKVFDRINEFQLEQQAHNRAIMELLKEHNQSITSLLEQTTTTQVAQGKLILEMTERLEYRENGK